jgi:hypothetical protein
MRTFFGRSGNYMPNMNTTNAKRRDAPTPSERALRVAAGDAIMDLRGWRLWLVARLIAVLSWSA